MKVQNWKKNVVLFIVSQAVSQFGSTLVQYAIMWHITLKTGSGLMMALSVLAGFLPDVLLSPLGGAWSDRYNRKKLIIYSDAFIALVTLAAAGLFFVGIQDIGILILLMGLRSVGSSIQSPSANALIPDLVPKNNLMRVNAINMIIKLIAPMAAGVLLEIAPLQVLFFIDVATAIVGIGLFSLIPSSVVAPRKQPEKEGVWKGIMQGLRYIKNNPYVIVFFGFLAIFCFLVFPAQNLASLQVKRNFGEGVIRLAIVQMALGLGMLVSGGVLSVWGGFRNRTHTLGLAACIVGVALTLLGFVRIYELYVAIAFFAGMAIPMFLSPAAVLLQEKTEPEYLGRVFGIMNMVSGFAGPVGTLIFGILADIISIDILFMVTGPILVALAFAFISNKKMQVGACPDCLEEDE